MERGFSAFSTILFFTVSAVLQEALAPVRHFLALVLNNVQISFEWWQCGFELYKLTYF